MEPLGAKLTMYKQDTAPLLCSELEFSMLFRYSVPLCSLMIALQSFIIVTCFLHWWMKKYLHATHKKPLKMEKPQWLYKWKLQEFFSSWHHKSHLRVRLWSCCSRDVCTKTNYNLDMTKQQIICTNLDQHKIMPKHSQGLLLRKLWTAR